MSFFSTKRIAFTGLLAMSLAFTGCLTDDDEPEDDPQVVSTPWGSATDVSVGAQGHASLGTAVDLDGKKAMLSAEVNAAGGLEKVDLLFVHSGGSHKLMTPVAAKEAGDVTLAANYVASRMKVVQFVSVSVKPTDSEAGMKAFNDASSKLTSATAAQGGKFVVKTGESKYAYVEVKSLAGSEKNAAADLTIAISGL
jgi:hypothetical protein